MPDSCTQYDQISMISGHESENRSFYLPSFASIISTRLKTRECLICFVRQPIENFPALTNCAHRSCKTCLIKVTIFYFI